MTQGFNLIVALWLLVIPSVAQTVGQGAPTETQLRPIFDYSESHGCSNITVYSINKAMTEILSVRLELDPKNLPSTSRPLVIGLADRSAPARVEVYVYRTDIHDWPCSDVSWGFAERPTTWVAHRGTVMVTAQRPKVAGGDYPVTLRITDVEFISPTGATIRPPGPMVIKTLAGSMVGG